MKKRNKSIPIGSIFAAVALPASVYASLQPIDLDFQPIDLGTIGEEILPRDVSGTKRTNRNNTIEVHRDKTEEHNGLSALSEKLLPDYGQKKGSSLTKREVLLQVPPIVSETQEIFRSINTGNIEGAINRILGILGQLGLLDPAYESARVGTDAVNPDGRSSENPYSNPRSPEEVYELQRHVNIVRSEIGQKLSQVVFGPQGQQTLARQNQAVAEAQQTSLKAQQGVVNTYQESARLALENTTYAKNVGAKAKQAQSANVSQDVLKALAAQSEDLAKIGAGNSAQLAHLGKAASYQSAQLSAANAQLVALNDKTQVLEVLSASQNYQTAQINAAIDHQNHYQQLKDSLQQNAAYQSSNSIYIPGLIPKGSVR